MNDPAQVRNAPEKIFVTQFPDLMPPTMIARDPMEIRGFWKEHGDIIIKPLYGNGGAGVFRIAEGDQNLAALLEIFATAFREPHVVQRYLPEVRKGDKRIILIDGIVGGAINRVPAEGEARSNMHVGGRPEPTTLTKREHEICETIGPELKAPRLRLRRHRRDRKLPDRDQRHLADRHPRGEAFWRPRLRSNVLGRGGGETAGVNAGSVTPQSAAESSSPDR